jgi:alkanesulfonate monooxygenase SsuD/methylene tetrahydromethanopterin reductase-like flavin-dependent oxidoreductase (luciferase family)
MLDNMSNGRIVAGLAPGAGAETFNYDVPSVATREQFWEAVDLITRAWKDDGPFRHEGKWYPMRYVNPWPKPMQTPHPPVWIPGSRSKNTMIEVAKRGFAFFLSSRSHGEETAKSRHEFATAIESVGDKYQPFRMGILLSVYVGETDAQAKEEAREGIWYFLKNCLKGHLRRTGRQLTFGPGVPYVPPKDFRAMLQHTKPDSKLLGDADSWEELEKSNSIVIGSPETVYRRLSALIKESEVGNLLIQFHLGNMPQGIVRASMKRFMEQVAPRLREESKLLFADRYGRELENPSAVAGVGVAQ